MKTQWSAKYNLLVLLLLSITLLFAALPVYAINGNGQFVGRQTNLPVTFTVGGWAYFCNPQNGIIPGGMVYNRFPIAFSCFEFYGMSKPNQMILGNTRLRLKYIGKTSCLQRLCLLLETACGGGFQSTKPGVRTVVNGCGPLKTSLDCPWSFYTPEGVFLGGGCLAAQTIALLMNVAYNDMRVMPRTPGVDLECYTLSGGFFKGKTVAEVFNIANRVLAGESPIRFGVTCLQLEGTLHQINSNYEFIDYNTYIDRGFLIPHEPFDPFDPPHCPTVPMECAPEP